MHSEVKWVCQRLFSNLTMVFNYCKKKVNKSKEARTCIAPVHNNELKPGLSVPAAV